jgi:hypothetical protein
MENLTRTRIAYLHVFIRFVCMFRLFCVHVSYVSSHVCFVCFAACMFRFMTLFTLYAISISCYSYLHTSIPDTASQRAASRLAAFGIWTVFFVVYHSARLTVSLLEFSNIICKARYPVIICLRSKAN